MLSLADAHLTSSGNLLGGLAGLFGGGGKGKKADDDEGDVYVVEAGDNLTSIAKQLNVTVNDIIKANPGVNPNSIQVGQELEIPENAQY